VLIITDNFFTLQGKYNPKKSQRISPLLWQQEHGAPETACPVLLA
jgi:hypothetical protein